MSFAEKREVLIGQKADFALKALVCKIIVKQIWALYDGRNGIGRALHSKYAGLFAFGDNVAENPKR